MFRNYCRTLIELLPVYMQIGTLVEMTLAIGNLDLHMGHGLIKPLFDSIHMLIDGGIEEEDFQCVGQILVRFGIGLNTYL